MIVLHYFLMVVSLLLVVLIVMAFGYMVALVVYKDNSLATLSYRKFSNTAKKFVRCLGGVGICGAIAFGINFAAEKVIWKRVNRVTGNYDARTDKVYINVKEFPDGAAVVAALQQPIHGLANHSGPDGKLDVVIVKGSDTAKLVVKRDSRTYDGYYVYYGGTDLEWDGCIREVRTKVFDRYSYRVE